ncbi:hypothetical protein, conserved [Babesia bigemina]|uniref:FUN14 family protein n=1 Tax=Babesia bigemina TaxID=5866 RepID=A0A061DD59_BABBI|nr:hypothetical protein, conserved [Babesia bigemina]CDR95975.1 hypothetical protein, conserved [Babesia bigemina]|eukprot:XP_012768161.1 hypothetical protein, conserved [Babesia bigemina]
MADESAFDACTDGDRAFEARGTLESLWRAMTNGEGPESFDHISFAGGVCFGTGFSIVLGRTLRGFCLVAAGGLFTTLILNHYRLISINREAIAATVTSLALSARERIDEALQGSGGPLKFLSGPLFGQHLPRERVISALAGTGVGFTLGLIVF